MFTAPVLDPDGPPYRGIRFPRRSWKIAAWTTTNDDGQLVLAATGYLLDQSPQLDRTDLTDRQSAQHEGPPPLGAHLTYLVPIVDVAALTGSTSDPFPPPTGPPPGPDRDGPGLVASPPLARQSGPVKAGRALFDLKTERRCH